MPETLERALHAVLARGPDGGHDAKAIGARARHLLMEFGSASTPLIGDAGFRALVVRSVHLVGGDHPWLSVAFPATLTEIETTLQDRIAAQPPDVAIKASVALLSAMTRLLVLFIGEEITVPLLRRAWPGLYEPDHPQEIPHE